LDGVERTRRDRVHTAGEIAEERRFAELNIAAGVNEARARRRCGVCIGEREI
jgi:hypothetical protein